MPDLSFLGLEFENAIVIIETNAKFGVKLKILTFGTKSVLFGYFWARILKTTYLKSAFLSLSKISF